MYIGIDIHKQYAQVAVVNENANLDEITREYAGSEAAIEATSNYYPIHDTLFRVRSCEAHCW